MISEETWLNRRLRIKDKNKLPFMLLSVCWGNDLGASFLILKIHIYFNFLFIFFGCTLCTTFCTSIYFLFKRLQKLEIMVPNYYYFWVKESHCRPEVNDMGCTSPTLQTPPLPIVATLRQNIERVIFLSWFGNGV